MISGDRLSNMGRSTAGHGHPRSLVIASEAMQPPRSRQPGRLSTVMSGVREAVVAAHEAVGGDDLGDDDLV